MARRQQEKGVCVCVQERGTTGQEGNHLTLMRSIPFSLAMWRTAGVARGFPSAPRKCEIGVGSWTESGAAGAGGVGAGAGRCRLADCAFVAGGVAAG